MAKNKHVDLFKDIIPCVDQGIKELWDAGNDEEQKVLARLMVKLVEHH